MPCPAFQDINAGLLSNNYVNFNSDDVAPIARGLPPGAHTPLIKPLSLMIVDPAPNATAYGSRPFAIRKKEGK